MRVFLAVVVFLVSADRAKGFALLGPAPPWQTETVGFDSFVGPMNINEEYRWNVPQVHYGFTPGFLSYFGEDGVKSVENAIAILNALPSADVLNIDDYPTESGRMNLRAAALNITDLKSTALSMLVQYMGLADPSRYAFVIRNRFEFPPGSQIINYYVIKRNFDPDTLQHSSYINGSLWTYIIEEPFTGDNTAWAVNFPVDPLEQLFPRTLPVASDSQRLYGIPTGFFWTQLTRDDVAGLKYLYRTANYNLENSLDTVSGGLPGSGAVADPTTGTGQTGFPGGGGTYDFPAGGVGGVGGDTYDFPFNITTNAVVGGGQAPVDDPDAVGGGGVFIRGGIGKVEFVRVNYDTLLGGFEPFTVRYSETVLTNGNFRSQSLTRLIDEPDIIFDASDLQGAPDNPVRFILEEEVVDWLNSAALREDTEDNFGPGVIVPPVTFTFNTVGPTAWHNQFFLTEDSALLHYPRWGSFDGSTNDPIIFPIDTSIFELEQQVGLGGP